MSCSVQIRVRTVPKSQPSFSDSQFIWLVDVLPNCGLAKMTLLRTHLLPNHGAIYRPPILFRYAGSWTPRHDSALAMGPPSKGPYQHFFCVYFTPVIFLFHITFPRTQKEKKKSIWTLSSMGSWAWACGHPHPLWNHFTQKAHGGSRHTSIQNDAINTSSATFQWAWRCDNHQKLFKDLCACPTPLGSRLDVLWWGNHCFHQAERYSKRHQCLAIFEYCH